MPEDNQPRSVPRVRNRHGTRVARRITCAQCGKEDRIALVPKDPSRALCRKCAFETWGLRDPDESALQEVQLRCATCSRTYWTSLPPGKSPKPGAECNDCYSGILSKQGNKAKRAQRVRDGVVRVNGRR